VSGRGEIRKEVERFMEPMIATQSALLGLV
jgi:hypothetical protein